MPTGVTFEDVVAGGVPAQWVTPDDAATSRVLLYFHGGGYCFCSIRSHGRLAGHLAKSCGCRGLIVDYRLAGGPASRSGHRRAGRVPVAPRTRTRRRRHRCRRRLGRRGIAVALLLKARDEGLPLPAAGVLMSPWVDLAMTADSVGTRADVDVRQDPASTRWCADQFLAGQDPHDPYASPLYADLAGLPPLYIQAGDWDILVDDSVRLADKARSSGVEVHLDLFPEMLHAHQMWAGNMPEADDAIDRIGEFVQRALSPRPATGAHHERVFGVPGRRCPLPRNRPGAVPRTRPRRRRAGLHLTRPRGAHPHPGLVGSCLLSRWR